MRCKDFVRKELLKFPLYTASESIHIDVSPILVRTAADVESEEESEEEAHAGEEEISADEREP